MSDHEMLLEILEQNRRYEKQRKTERIVMAVIILALMIALILVGVRLSQTVQQLQANVDGINAAAQAVSDSFRQAGYENVGQALQDLHDTTEKVNAFLEALGENGLENIGQSIGAMNDAVEKLNGFFDALGENGAESIRQGVEALNSAVEKLNSFFSGLGESGIGQGVGNATDWLFGLFGG